MIRNNPVFIDNPETEAKIYPSQLYKEGEKVVRYKCQSENRDVFDLYIPNQLINRISSTNPPELCIYIQTVLDQRNIRFLKKIESDPIVDLDYIELDFTEEMGNSIKYSINWNNSSNLFYIPKKEFKFKTFPSRIYLFISL
ncbi:MAG: hypothetical protein FP831_18150 [Anaerolineae bacterium]|nr:hypothetical protein [Anaerolineae bacterium]